MTNRCKPAALLAVLLLAPAATAQGLDLKTVVEALDKDGSFVLKPAGVTISTFDFKSDGRPVEALVFRPTRDGRYPGLLLIPGYSRTARDTIPLGVRFAREGFACVAVTQPGFGRSQGPPDFVGPVTLAALEAGFQRFRSEPYVDATKLGVYGYSRGAMAASLLAVRLKELRAAVLGAGIYDLKRAYDEIQIDGIKKNIEKETGLTAEAFRQRSSVHAMEKLVCPVLILHGDKDENAPVSQAHLLRDRLTELKKDFEIKVYAGKAHDLGMQDVFTASLDFFRKRLLNAAPEKKD